MDRSTLKTGPKRLRKARRDWGEGLVSQYPKKYGGWDHGRNPLGRQPTAEWEYEAYLDDQYEEMVDASYYEEDLWGPDYLSTGELVYSTTFYHKPMHDHLNGGITYKRSHPPYYRVHDEDCPLCIAADLEGDELDDYSRDPWDEWDSREERGSDWYRDDYYDFLQSPAVESDDAWVFHGPTQWDDWMKEDDIEKAWDQYENPVQEWTWHISSVTRHVEPRWDPTHYLFGMHDPDTYRWLGVRTPADAR